MIPPRAFVADRVDSFISTTCTREEENRKGLTRNDVLRDLSGVKRVGTLLRKPNSIYCEQVSMEWK